jgi:hypothetical protein
MSCLTDERLGHFWEYFTSSTIRSGKSNVPAQLIGATFYEEVADGVQSLSVIEPMVS